MSITVNWLQNDYHLEAENETGGKIRMDGKTNIGGLEGGLSPFELLLAGIGGCSAVDVISILEKQKQELKNLKVDVEADKQKTGTYSQYKSIHMHFILEGNIEPQKAERALELSITKYCSVAKALEKSSEITYDFTIKN